MVRVKLLLLCLCVGLFQTPCFALDVKERTLIDRVDLIEVNHYYDEKGRLVFDQVIFYDWSSAAGRYQVRDWRLIKSPQMRPSRQSNGTYVAIWNDDGALRKVVGLVYRESWTNYDPEFVERVYLPKDHRSKLRSNAEIILAKIFAK